MKTVEAIFTEDTTLLIQGVKGKLNAGGDLTDSDTIERLKIFVTAFEKQINL